MSSQSLLELVMLNQKEMVKLLAASIEYSNGELTQANVLIAEAANTLRDTAAILRYPGLRRVPCVTCGDTVHAVIDKTGTLLKCGQSLDLYATVVTSLRTPTCLECIELIVKENAAKTD